MYKLTDRLINKLRDMLIKSKLYTLEEFEQMDYAAMQLKFIENLQILETVNLIKEKRETYYIIKSSTNDMLTSDKALKIGRW
mgnify:FL=1